MWDAPPFAVNLNFAFKGLVNHCSLNLSNVIKSVRHDFFSPASPVFHTPKVQKLLTAPIKTFLFPDNSLSSLSYKASLQKILISESQINDVLKSFSRQPFIISATFHKILTNALCTTSRIKNHPTLTCFACGKARDDLYHFIRCPAVAFIFNLSPAFGTINFKYFTAINVAKIAVLFETYYIVTRQYGKAFLKSSFVFIANKTSYIARHVAIKNKIQHLARIKIINENHVHEFCNMRKNHAYFYPNILDAACL